MTSRLTLREMIKSLLPKGRAWSLVPSSHFENLMDGLGDCFEEVVDKLSSLSSLRDPAQTEILSDLEKEYGISQVSIANLTEAQRREVLAGKVYAAPGWGSDDLEARLHAAGFTGLLVHRNEDRVDPNYYLGGEWVACCGHQDTVCGNENAFCGQDGFDGVLLVNGPTHYAGSSDIEYEIPVSDGHWHMVFFVGGEIVEAAQGWVFIEDGDMEDADTSAWTAGNDATLAKDAVTFAEGAKSLKVTGTNYFHNQNYGIDVLDDNNTAALRMHDNGDNVIYDVGPAGNDGENGTSYTNPTLDPGTNSTDATALSFNGVDEGACIDGAISVDSSGLLAFWAKIEGNSREDTFRLRPQASGYSNIPDDLLLDGETISADVQLKGDEATASQWTADFAVGGSGADLTFDEITPGIGDTRVVFSGAKYYQASAAGTGNPTTNDFWIGIIHKHVDESAVLLSKYTSAGDHLEIDVVSGGNALRASLNGTTITSSVTMDVGCWYYSVLVGDRGGNMRWYVNHTSGGAVDISGASAASPGNAASWAIGARTGGTSQCSASIAYVEMFIGAGMYATDQVDDAVKRRAAYVYGVFPETYNSTLTLPGVADLDTEEADTSSWSSTDATLSKESGTRTGGSGSHILRITPDGVSTLAIAQQASKYTIGREYTLSGWARADGSTVAVPAIVAGDGATEVWSGAASSTWAEFFVTFTATGTTFELACSGTTSGSAWAEFDDLSLTVDGGIPVSLGRASISALNKWDVAETESYLVWVGDNWVAVDEALDESGVRIEIPNTNECLYSSDFTHATWTKSACTVTGDADTGLGETSFDAIVADATSAGHYISQDVTITPTSGEHGVSVYAKAGTVSGLKIVHEDGTNQHAYFDLSAGAVGDVGAGLTGPHPASIEDLGGGVYRCYISVIAQNATLEIRIYPSDGATEGDEVFAGDASDESVYIYGAMVEEDVHQCLSIIETSGSAVSRDEDDLVFQGWEQITTQSGDEGILRVRAKLDEPAPHAGRYFASLDDGASADNVQVSCVADDDALGFSVTDGSSAQAAVSSDEDLDTIHAWVDVEVSWRADNFHVFVDNILDTQDDTSGTVPAVADLDYIRIGQTASGGRLNGVVSDFQLSEYGLIRPRGLAGVNDAAAEGTYIGYVPGVTDGTFRPVVGIEGFTQIVGSELDDSTWHHLGVAWDEDAPNFDYTFYADGSSDGTYTGTEDPTSFDSVTIGWAPTNGYDETSTATAYSVALGEAQIADVLHRAGETVNAAWWEDTHADGEPPYERALVHEISATNLGGGGGGVYYLKDLVGGLTGDTPSATDEPVRYITPYGYGVGNDETVTDFVAEFGASDFMGALNHTFSAIIKIDVDDDQVLWENDPGAAPPGDTTVEYPASSTIGVGQPDFRMNNQLKCRYKWFNSALDTWSNCTFGDNVSAGRVSCVAQGTTALAMDGAAYLCSCSSDGEWDRVAQSVADGGDGVSSPGGVPESMLTYNNIAYCFRYTTSTVYSSSNGVDWTDLGTPDSSGGVYIYTSCFHDGTLWCAGYSNGKIYERFSGAWYHRTTSPSTSDVYQLVSHDGELWCAHSGGDVYSWNGSGWTARNTTLGFRPSTMASDGTDIFIGLNEEIYIYDSGTTWTKITDQATEFPTATQAQDACISGYSGAYHWNDSGNYNSYNILDDQAYPIQQLKYEATANKLTYTFKSSYAENETSITFNPNEYHHVAVRRDYDATEGITTVNFFIDGVKQGSIGAFSGSPVVTEDDLFVYADHDADNRFRGSMVGVKFFDDDLTDAEILAQYTRSQELLLLGPYATQDIVGTDIGVRLQGFQLPDGEGGTYDTDWSAGYPLVLYQEYDGGDWKIFEHYSAINDDTWESFDKTVERFFGIRLYSKCFKYSASFSSWFDDIDGGEDPGENTIAPVQIPREQKYALEELILRRKPLHSWCILVVEYI